MVSIIIIHVFTVSFLLLFHKSRTHRALAHLYTNMGTESKIILATGTAEIYLDMACALPTIRLYIKEVSILLTIKVLYHFRTI